MEDGLDLCAEAEDPLRPRVCFDEYPYQLLTERIPDADVMGSLRH